MEIVWKDAYGRDDRVDIAAAALAVRPFIDAKINGIVSVKGSSSPGHNVRPIDLRVLKEARVRDSSIWDDKSPRITPTILVRTGTTFSRACSDTCGRRSLRRFKAPV